MIRVHHLWMGLFLIVMAIGCGSSKKEEDIPIKGADDPLKEPRSLLQNYAKGQPIGSEVTTFPSMIEKVRKADPKKADMLEKGLKELQKAPPAARRAKAKALLDKL